MKIKDAILKINNRDVSGLRRKFATKYSLIQINRKGKIEGLYKYKQNPSEVEQLEALNKHPMTVQIPAREDTYKNEQELKKAIDQTMWLFDKMKK